MTKKKAKKKPTNARGPYHRWVPGKRGGMVCSKCDATYGMHANPCNRK
jgi:hypothetical protein